MPEMCAMPTGSAVGGQAAEAGGSNIILLVVMLAVFFFLMILPQRKRNKKVKNMLASVKSGDKIKTIGGFYGVVESVKEELVTISCDPDRLRLVISKTAIAAIENADVENEVTLSK